MQARVNVVTASVVGKYVAIACHVDGDLPIGAVLHTSNKRGHWKVTSLGWPTLAQAQGRVATKGVVVTPSSDADVLQEGDVLLIEKEDREAA